MKNLFLHEWNLELLVNDLGGEDFTPFIFGISHHVFISAHKVIENKSLFNGRLSY